MTGDNAKYGLMISDGRYIQRLIEDFQCEIDRDDGIPEDALKEGFVNRLDDLGIYPFDVDYILSELQF